MEYIYSDLILNEASKTTPETNNITEPKIDFLTNKEPNKEIYRKYSIEELKAIHFSHWQHILKGRY